MTEKLRILICGGRDFRDWDLFASIIDQQITGYRTGDITIISGAARGADTLAIDYALAHGIECKLYPADWKKFKKAAGPIRNQQMLDEGKPNLVLAFPTPNSIGTWDMVHRAKLNKIKTIVVSAVKQPSLPELTTGVPEF